MRFDKFAGSKFERRPKGDGPEGAEGKMPELILSPRPIEKSHYVVAFFVLRHPVSDSDRSRFDKFAGSEFDRRLKGDDPEGAEGTMPEVILSLQISRHCQIREIYISTCPRRPRRGRCMSLNM